MQNGFWQRYGYLPKVVLIVSVILVLGYVAEFVINIYINSQINSSFTQQETMYITKSDAKDIVEYALGWITNAFVSGVLITASFIYVICIMNQRSHK